MKSRPIDENTWTARQDQIVEFVSPEVAAEKLGRTVEAVLTRRKDLGLSEHPPWQGYIKKREANGG